MKDSELFAIAGTWQTWLGEPPTDTFALVTVEPNELVRPFHDRKAVILPPDDYDLWLDPKVKAADALLPLLKSFDATRMTAAPVSTKVNSPR